jgi:exopolyphosphatase/guanosine-5'-triphosphate,3'-diphosphate pyrophosphatase
VFARVLETLRQSGLYYSVAGVRDGIIADLVARGVGRELSRLTRQQQKVVDAMCRKYNTDVKNAKHVAKLSVDLFDSLISIHKVPTEYGKLLDAAAYLHNTGHFISDTAHHKHSAYVVMNSDLPGFTDRERMLIALLCRYHRKSLPMSRHEPYGKLAAEDKRIVNALIPLLRIAVGLDSTKQQKVTTVECQLGPSGATLYVKGTGDMDLELWAAEQGAIAYREIYNSPLVIAKARK